MNDYEELEDTDDAEACDDDADDWRPSNGIGMTQADIDAALSDDVDGS
jgi:hypothetical protein